MVKSQAIADLLAQFPKEEQFSLDDKVSGEVTTVEMAREQWAMKFNGSYGKLKRSRSGPLSQ